MFGRVALVEAHTAAPVVGDAGEARIKRRAQATEQIGQRISKIPTHPYRSHDGPYGYGCGSDLPPGRVAISRHSSGDRSFSITAQPQPPARRIGFSNRTERRTLRELTAEVGEMIVEGTFMPRSPYRSALACAPRPSDSPTACRRSGRPGGKGCPKRSRWLRRRWQPHGPRSACRCGGRVRRRSLWRRRGSQEERSTPGAEWRAVPHVQRQVEPFARFVDEPHDLGQIIAKLLFVRDQPVVRKARGEIAA